VSHSITDRNTQRGRLLGLLIAARGGWVPLAEVMAAGGAQYNARVHSIRHDLRLNIQNWVEGSRSWFRLVPSPTPAPQPKPELPEQSKLFGDIAPDRSYRE
jgi:hypothetical protein